MTDRPRPQVTRQDLPDDPRGTYAPRRLDGKWFFCLRTANPRTRAPKYYPVGRCQSCEGHESADGARAHFREFLLRDQLRLNMPRGDGKHWTSCTWCVRQGRWGIPLLLKIVWRRPLLGEWLTRKFGRITVRYALVSGGFYAWALCSKHQTTDIVNVLMPEEIGDFAG